MILYIIVYSIRAVLSSTPLKIFSYIPFFMKNCLIFRFRKRKRRFVPRKRERSVRGTLRLRLPRLRSQRRYGGDDTDGGLPQSLRRFAMTLCFSVMQRSEYTSDVGIPVLSVITKNRGFSLSLGERSNASKRQKDRRRIVSGLFLLCLGNSLSIKVLRST